LKPHTISFGQALDPEVLNLAVRWARSSDLMLACGSSLVVEPAASLPRLAKRSGARLVIINREATPLDSLADLLVKGPVGSLLDAAISNPPR